MATITLPYSTTTATTQVRALIGEASAGFWTDTEIATWLLEGSIDVATKSLCIEHSNTVDLVDSQLEYTDFESAPTSNGIAQVLKVYACIYDDEATPSTYKGLKKMQTRHLGRRGQDTQGVPYFYYHFAGKIGVWPLPSTAIGTTGQLLVNCSIIYFADDTEAIASLPEFYQQFAIQYAAAMARFKERKNAEGMALYTKYIQSMNIHRADIYERPVDTNAMMQEPHRTVEAR